MPHPGHASNGTEDLGVDVGAYGAVISEFYPCAVAGDEYFSISSRGNSPHDLRNWSVTDGEGEIRFISDMWLFPGRSITFSFNATSYWCAYDRMPDICLGYPEIDSLLAISGSFKLADAGDSLVLVSPQGGTIDEVIYGSTDDSATEWLGAPLPALRKGEVAKRIESNGFAVDTNSASDWQPFREFRYGYTEFEPRTFEIPAGNITAFTSPDCSFDVVAASISKARSTISICTYELSSIPICEKLLQALERGVSLRLLVDGAPAGDMDDDEIACLSMLRTAGADVRTVNGNLSKGIVQHVGAVHSKYMVIDSAVSIVMSENLVEDGLPQDRAIGNRGWGVRIEDASLANYLLELFESDSRRSRVDVRDWREDFRFNGSSALTRAPANTSTGPLIKPLVSTHRASVSVVISPDGSVTYPYLVDFMEASTSLAVEQFQVDLFWTSRWTDDKYLNPLVRSLLISASRGVAEKVLLDSSWFNIDRNRLVIDCLAGNSTSDSSDYGLLDDRSPITLLHNKGAVIDGVISAITSNNWVSASFARNRELAVMVNSEEVASHFMTAFEYDFIPDETPPVCEAGSDIELMLGRSIVLNAEQCSDDRQIYEYCWDFDSDGMVDSHEEQSLFNGDVPGEHVVVLKVTDAWGNSATDELHVNVIVPSMEARGGLSAVPRALWLAPVLAAAAVLAAKVVKMRRAASDTRNINHRPRS